MSEKSLHKAVCDYIRLAYPSVIFNTDLSGLRMTFGQAAQVKHLRSANGFPDIVIYKVVFKQDESNHYYGLFIELKKEGERIFKKNGEPASDHIAEQIAMIERLNKEGYYATFCIGFDQAKSVIDWYLK